VDVGGGGDRQVHRSAARFPAAVGDGGGEASPFTGDGRIDREGVEGRLDHTESLCPAGALVGIGRDERPEVKFGERRGADCSFELSRLVRADQD
jgi:hypothetical protein